MQLALTLAFFLAACAAGTAPATRGDSGSGGGMDAAGRDAGATDAATSDGTSASDGGGDSGSMSSGVCAACEDDGDCQTRLYCADLRVGGRGCLPACEPDLPECPPRFDCVADFSTTIPEPVCAPVGERCCVDADADLHGTGVGCLGADCNDDDPMTHASAMELCDRADNDCNGTPDDGPIDTMCPRGTHVAGMSCVGGTCTVAMCEPGFDDCNRMASDGCETSTRTVTDCGMCAMPCSLAHATSDCSSGACTIASCDVGWGDCDGRDDTGCETSLTTLTDCGGCGRGCSHARGTSSCATGMCTLASCDAGYDNCNGNPSDGCETALTTNSNCGGCGTLCAPDRGTGDCSTGMCRIVSCTSGYDDCDMSVATGCERSTRTVTDCGACGVPCSHAHASSSCGSGMCSLVSCDPGWGNCDGVIGTGCERSLTTLTDCAGCGIPCSFTGATASCGTGTCAFGSCLSGRSSCDGTTTNGCEVNHATVSGSCPGATDLGTYDGDRSCGFICGSNTAWDNFANATGRTSAWYQARVREDSSCSTSIEHRIRLTVPAGVDYDLYVYRPCGTLVTFSDAGTGLPEQITISSTDDGGTDDSFTYFIEVRYFSGASCSQWTLSLDGHDC